MKLKLLLLAFCFVIVSLVVLSYWRQTTHPKFGLDYNPERQKLGIPVIPADWSSMVTDSNITSWYDPQGAEKRGDHLPYHASKDIYSQNGILSSEADTYFGPTDYNDNFSMTPQRERITITYLYNENGWFVSYMSQATHNTGEYTISINQAKTFLASWGLEYP